MITDPAKYAEAFVKAGSDHLTFHIEVSPTPMAIASRIRSLGASVGITLNPGTPASAIRDALPAVDMVLVMSVWPGFGGQRFLSESLEKVREIRALLRPDQRLEIDGGIDPQTVGAAAVAGVDTFVAGSAVFGRPDPAQAMHELVRIATQARAEAQ
jgi:ribulose-phosphate 3-epimerase